MLTNPYPNLNRNQKQALLASAVLRAGNQRRFGVDIVDQYRGDELAFITDGLRQCREDSWYAWRVILKAAYGKLLTTDELELFRDIAKREPPNSRVKELWLVIGRRGGKDSVASCIAAQAACYADEGYALRPGERSLVACFATDRSQARIVYNYTKAYFEKIPSLRRRVVSNLTPSPMPIVLSNQMDGVPTTEIAIVTSSYRAPRGWPIACAIFDEVAFWLDENSANPDKEIYNAVLGGSSANTMIVGISTPYRQAGLLFDRWKEYHGKNDDDVLVVQAPTLALHPNFDQSIITRALREDPEKARAEYYAEWRRDVADYVSREVVDICTVKNRFELAFDPQKRGQYVAFCDPSGGSSDSMTLAIAHKEGKYRTVTGVLDCIREVRAPFSPESVVREFVEVLKSYGIKRVKGDHYAGEWPRERFSLYGITYELSELTKSEIYREFLPHLNTKYVELLDIKRLTDQLCGLERRTIRGGRDSIDHRPDGHDDVINAAAGALLQTLDRHSGPIVVSDRTLMQSRFPSSLPFR